MEKTGLSLNPLVISKSKYILVNESHWEKNRINRLSSSCLFSPIENNLMGAAEWTGYTNSSPTYPTPTYSVLPPPGPAPPTAASYGYDIANMDHPSNFHIPTGECFGELYSLISDAKLTWCYLSNRFSGDRNAIVLFFWISFIESSGTSPKFIGFSSFNVGW